MDKDRHLVAKGNNLIEARYRLSVQEQRLMAIMVSDVSPNDTDFKTYRYKVSDFVEWIKVEGKDYYRELKKITARLLTRLITIKENNKTIQTSWLSSAVYIENAGVIELRFDPALKPYILQLQKCFTQYALKNVLELKSKYAFRLYELLKQYQAIGKRRFSVKELREQLGVEQGELKLWIHFKTRVLEISKREINQKTDIKIDYKTEKIGRKIEYVIFSIKAQERDLDKKTNERYTELLKLIPDKYKKLKTIQNTIIKYLKKKGFEYVERNIKYANEKADSNYRVYLINSLKGDWAEGWWEDFQSEQSEIEKRKYLNQIKKVKDKQTGEEFEVVDGCAFTPAGVIPWDRMYELIESGQFEILEKDQ